MRSSQFLRGLCCAALCATLLPGAATSQASATSELRLEYEVYVGGLYSMALEIDLRFDGERYEVRSKMEADGLASWFSDFVLNSATDGRFLGMEAVPANYRNDYAKKGKRRWVAMTYDENGARQTAAVPAPAEDNRTPLPVEDYAQAIDPLTGIVWIMAQIKAEGDCGGQKRIYDGRRLYEMRAETLRAPGQSVGGQAAYVCSVDLRHVKGFSQKEIDRQSLPERLRLVFAPAVKGGPLVPVRIDTEIGSGPIQAHLVKVGDIVVASSRNEMASQSPGGNRR